MNSDKKKVSFAFILAVITVLYGELNAFAAPIKGSGTSTFISVFSGVSTITGFPNLTFDGASSLFTVNGTSNLLGLTFTSATGTSLNVSTLAFANASGTNISVTGYGFFPTLNFTNASGTNLIASSISSTNISSTNITVGNPVGVTSGGTATSSFTYGVVVASGTQAFDTIAPSASGNVLTSNGVRWGSSQPTVSSSSIGTSQLKIETVTLSLANSGGAVATTTVAEGSVILGWYFTSVFSSFGNLMEPFTLSISGTTLTAATGVAGNFGGSMTFVVVLLKP